MNHESHDVITYPTESTSNFEVPQNEIPTPDEGLTCVREFQSHTTLHGLAYVFGSKSPWRRRLWLLLVLLCTAGVIIQVIHNFETMFDYDSTVNITTIFNSSLKFPAVSICNENMFRKSKTINSTADDFVKYFDGTNDNLTEEVLNATIDLKKEAMEKGHNLSDMLLGCTWNKKRCKPEQLTPYFSLKSGKCFTFNGRNKGYEPLSTPIKGTKTGLDMLLDVQPEEYYSSSNIDVGFRIVVHDQKQEPQMSEFGINISPGFRADFALKLKKITRLRYPYRSTCGERTLTLSDKAYSVSRCEEECTANNIVKTCKCKVMEYGDNFQNVSLCRLREYTCVFGVVYRSVNCKCPLPCEETKYEVEISTSYHPSPQFISTAKLFYETANFTNDNEFTEFYRKRVVHIRAHYQSFAYEILEEKAAYLFPSFLADLGGSLGLFLGCSILTVCEFVDLILSALGTLIKQCFNRNTVHGKREWVN